MDIDARTQKHRWRHLFCNHGDTFTVLYERVQVYSQFLKWAKEATLAKL